MIGVFEISLRIPRAPQHLLASRPTHIWRQTIAAVKVNRLLPFALSEILPEPFLALRRSLYIALCKHDFSGSNLTTCYPLLIPLIAVSQNGIMLILAE